MIKWNDSKNILPAEHTNILVTKKGLPPCVAIVKMDSGYMNSFTLYNENYEVSIENVKEFLWIYPSDLFLPDNCGKNC